MNAQNTTLFPILGLAFSVTNSEEQSILEGLKNLDSQVISIIYDRYFEDVYRFVYYRLNDEQVAEDVSSDVFVRLLEAVKERRGPQTNLKGWLLGTASHVVSDHLREVYQHPTKELSDILLNGLFSPLPDEVDHREMVRSFRLAYSHLTLEQQNVLALRFGTCCSLVETARIMQKNVNAVKALQFRALAALQRKVGELTNG
jgi:RNA polymerase sigma-70 factor (ECF subfamily)